MGLGCDNVRWIQFAEETLSSARNGNLVYLLNELIPSENGTREIDIVAIY
jgi:hypothetical protein